MFRETTSAHRKTLQEAIHMLSPEEHAKIADQERVLDKVRSELQSISHERVIMDVLVRPTITETKRLYARNQADNEKVLQKRYTTSLTGTGTRVQQKQVLPPGLTDSNQTSRSSSTTYRSHRTSTNAAYSAPLLSTNSKGDTAPVSAVDPDKVGFDHTAELLNKPIHIPNYDPTKLPEFRRARSATTSTARSGSVSHGLGGYLNFAYDYENSNGNAIASNSSKLLARAVGGSLMVSESTILNNILVSCSRGCGSAF